jgi:hypothetical protein
VDVGSLSCVTDPFVAPTNKVPAVVLTASSPTDKDEGTPAVPFFVLITTAMN